MSENTTFTPVEGVESYMLGVISTAHVSKEAHQIFEHLDDNELYFIQNLEYGWLVTLFSTDNDDHHSRWYNLMQAAGVDSLTIANFQTMCDKGYTVLMLDRDGEIVPFLTEFEY